MNQRLIYFCIVFLMLLIGCGRRTATQSLAVSNPKVEASDVFLRTKEPLSLTEAQGLVKISFPPTATNVQFYLMQDFPIVERYIRF